MSLYVVEEKLTTTIAEKAQSWAMAVVISGALIFILYFLKISVSNPPFEIKQGVVELDFGVVDGGFGKPDQGGPSPTAPALGGDQGSSGTPDQGGGIGKVITNEGEKNSANLPPIDPPSSANPSGDPRTGRLGSIGKRTGSGPGDPNGFPGGTGRTGSGTGGNTGVTGNGGERPGKKGVGNFDADFNNFKLASSVTKVNADGEGDIVCWVTVDCAGRASVYAYGVRGTTYTGSQSNMKAVFDYFLSNSSFTKIGEQCPEKGKVTLRVKRTI